MTMLTLGAVGAVGIRTNLFPTFSGQACSTKVVGNIGEFDCIQ
jgi:hypothetical protein